MNSVRRDPGARPIGQAPSGSFCPAPRADAGADPRPGPSPSRVDLTCRHGPSWPRLLTRLKNSPARTPPEVPARIAGQHSGTSCTTIRSLSQRSPLPYEPTQGLPSFADDCFQLPCGWNLRRLCMASKGETSIKRTIRRQQLREMVPLADSTIYEMEQRGEFPRRFALSPRCVVWDLSEVQAWLASRRSAPIARAQHPDVMQRRSRPVKALGGVPRAASTAE